MGLVLCFVAFCGAVALSRRSLGAGTGFVLLVGCIYGWLRCWFYNPATHFVFDASLLGLYAVAFIRRHGPVSDSSRALQNWALVLAAIPLLVLFASPLIEGQPFVIQLVGLRSVFLFVPVILIATWLTDTDVEVVSDWALLCVVVATVFAVGELILGVDKFFPINAASRNIFSAADAGPTFETRLPASFGSSHLYGGTMVAFIPLLVLRLERARRFQTLTRVGLVAAACGAFLCSARIPVLTLAFLVVVWSAATRNKRSVIVSVVLGAIAVSVLVVSSARFRRYETLRDSEVLETRLGLSANRGLVDVVLENPIGRGLASAVGTSIPYFLADDAKPQEGLESEFSRLALELGFGGLIAWLLFVLWCLAWDIRQLKRFGGAVDALMWSVCVAAWLTGVIGAGVLNAIPGTFLLVMQMTLVASQRVRPAARGERLSALQPLARTPR
jgi:hypothetical protein